MFKMLYSKKHLFRICSENENEGQFGAHIIYLLKSVRDMVSGVEEGY